MGDRILELNNYLEGLASKGKDALLNDPFVQQMLTKQDISGFKELVERLMPEFSQVFLDGINKGVKLGYIPAVAQERAGTALRYTDMQIMESSVSMALGGFAAGYADHLDQVGITAAQENESKQEMLINLTHEFTHKISGSTFLVDETTKSGYRRPRLGLATDFEGKDISLSKHAKVGINEAVTQHLALAFLHGDFETIDPATRQDGDASYGYYRTVLADFIDKSGGIIKLQTLFAAYFEDTSPSGGFTARKQLIREATEAYGPGALRKLGELMEADIVREPETGKPTSFITAPIFDHHRKVIKHGHIESNPDIIETLREYSSGTPYMPTN